MKEFTTILLMVVASVLLMGIPVMLLYNGVLVNILPGLDNITYSEAVGLYILCNLLFRHAPTNTSKED